MKFSNLTLKLSGAALAVLFSTTFASAQLIVIDNDFESLTAGESVSSGDPYGGAGSDADLGNAALHQASDITANAGVGDSNAITFNNGGIFSRNEFDVTQEATFNFYFKYLTDNRNDSYLYVGWGDPPTITPFNGGSDTLADVVSFGITRVEGDGSSDNIMQYSGSTGGGAMSGNSELAGSPTFTLVDGNFYRFTGSMTLELNTTGSDDAWDMTLADLALQDYGSDGTTAGSLLGEWAGTSYTANDKWGIDFMDDSAAHFFIGANSPRGANNFDNVYVTSIPEPSAALLLGMAMSGLMFIRRRR